MNKLNLTTIVAPEDVLLDDLNNIKGGADFNICLKGCIQGDNNGDGDPGEDDSSEDNPPKDNPPTDNPPKH